MVDAVISALLKNLAPLIKDEFSLLWNCKEEVERLSSTLTTIYAVLEDAERKTLWENDKQTEIWLKKITLIAYNIRDIMDEWIFEDLRLQVKRINASSSKRIQVTNSIALPLGNILTSRKIGHKIKDIRKKLDIISSEREKLKLCEYNIRDSNSATTRIQTISKLVGNVYGRTNEETNIVKSLVHDKFNNKAKEVSVLPILGIGGLGKTSLARLVFNNMVVEKHFDLKFWVCVSKDFDINLIIKAIIGATNETSLEILKNIVQDRLKGKKYLLVLDDVWNEEDELWNVLKSILNCGSNGSFILTTTRKKIVAEKMKTVEPFNLSRISEDDCLLLFEEHAFKQGIPKTKNFIDIGKEIAIKCNGVPLVAKTLGSQLGFKNDEKEWLRIRDSEMWKISQNENNILHILRWSYYDLPYSLRKYFALCAIFPKDIEIEKERLIQWWMAHDLIPSNKNQELELEEDGKVIWDELYWRSFFEEEKLNLKGVQICKMHDLMHDLAQSLMKDECYTMDKKSSNKDFQREIRHVTIIVDDCEKSLFDSLKNKGGLQSIILHSNHNEKVSKETFSVGKEFSSLRVFEGCSAMQHLNLRYVRFLKHLRYLNLSGNKMLKTLPDSICNLLNLQTLNLNHCKLLESLPENTKDLINLRNLYLEGCDKLKCMPRRMGQLKHLKTLSLFVIGKKSDGQLNELKELNIRGTLKIRNLESVSDESITRGISMSEKLSINDLELYWNDDTNNSQEETRHEKIGEALEVSTKCLKRMIVSGYNGVNIPSYEIGMPVLFPLLEELRIEDMKNLRELVSPPPIPITTIGPLHNLSKLYIHNCPKLGALPPNLNSLKDVYIRGEYSDELLHSISNLSSLTHLSLMFGDAMSILVEAANRTSNDDVVLFPLLEELRIEGMMNLREYLMYPPPIPITTTGAFHYLCRLSIYNCPELGPLPPHFKSLVDLSIEGECSDELLHSISSLSGLTRLSLGQLGERSVLFPVANNYEELWLDYDEITSSTLADNNESQGGRSALQSLRRLEIKNCCNLRCLFEEECEELAGGRETRGLTNLNYLCISECPELMISVQQWRNLTHSLQELLVGNCPKLVPSKREEAVEVNALLRSLRERVGPQNINVILFSYN